MAERRKGSPKPRVERRREPFSNLEDTEWGRRQEERHRENVARFEKGDARFDGLEKKADATLKIASKTDKKLDQLIRDTSPIVKVRRFVKLSHKSATKWGRFSNRLADGLLRFGKLGATMLLLYVAFQALVHGASPAEALKLLWQVLIRT